jgi:LuxR family maltose regulon positive regulatory protein
MDAPGEGMVVVDDAEFRRLPVQVAMYRAALARFAGDVPGTMRHARRIFDLAAEDDHLGRGAAGALLGLACWSQGDLDAASRWYVEAIASLDRSGHRSDALGCTLAAADIRRAQGRLAEALRLLRHGAKTAHVPDEAPLRGAADMGVGIAEILLEQGDAAGAAEHLRQARQLGDGAGLPQNPYRSRVVAAQLALIDGDRDAAFALLAEAERVVNTDFSPDVRPVAALTARLRIAEGRLDDGWAWARDRGLSATDDLEYLREFEHLTLARLLVAHGIRDGATETIVQALELTGRLLAAAEDGGRTGSVVESLVVEALARQALGDRDGAVAAVRRAAALAEPEGHVRVFLDEGPAMTLLLHQVARDRTAPPFVGRLLLAAGSGPLARRPARTPGLIEPLSDRELEVLRLLQGDLDGPDIARELIVSLNTLRTHTKNIYAKLGVSNRRAAVRRAQELDLLAR